MPYTLEPYSTPSSRYRCPACNHRDRTFVRYIDTETRQHLADHVGRCGRENNCGYHYKPSQYFQEQGGWRVAQGVSGKRIFKPRKKAPRVIRPTQLLTAPRQSYDFLCIHPDVVNASFKQYDRNNLVQYLIQQFGFDKADELVGRYRIGTAKHWPGSTVFWQIDTLGQARTGKVMLYDTHTGKRVKKPFSHITWVHALLNPKSEVESQKSNPDLRLQTQDFRLRQCLFGEHLLKEFPSKQVAIVESEKTAIIASACDDSFVWLACGSINNLNAAICKALNGRRVTLYPDLGAYDKWKTKARQLEAAMRKSRFMISDILEQHANAGDRKNGLDLGDFLKRINNNKP